MKKHGGVGKPEKAATFTYRKTSQAAEALKEVARFRLGVALDASWSQEFLNITKGNRYQPCQIRPLFPAHTRGAGRSSQWTWRGTQHISVSRVVWLRCILHLTAPGMHEEHNVSIIEQEADSDQALAEFRYLSGKELRRRFGSDRIQGVW